MFKKLARHKYRPHEPKDHSKILWGVILTLVGWFLSAAQTNIIKVTSNDLPTPVIFFFLFLFIFFYLSFFVSINQDFSHFVPKRWGLLFFRCLVSVGSYFA